jgi:drug/metabolite transporter (DMT)-like permease
VTAPESSAIIPSPQQRPDQKPRRRYGAATYRLGLFLTAAIWASTFINIKVVLLQLPPNTIAFLRFLVASLALGLYMLYTHQPPIRRQDWLRLAACGLTGVTLYNFLQNQGLRYAGSTDASILAAMAPVFLALLAWLLLKERISLLQTLGIAIALTGSVLVATNGTLAGFALNPMRLYGDCLVLLTGLAWAIYSTLVKTLLERYPATTVLAYTTFAGTLFLLPLSLAELPINFAAVTLSIWLNILYLGLFASALAYLIWNLALSRVPAVTAAAYIYLIPVLTAVMVAVYYRQLPSLYIVAGGLIVLLGTYLASRSEVGKVNQTARSRVSDKDRLHVKVGEEDDYQDGHKDGRQQVADLDLHLAARQHVDADGED